MPIVKLDPKTVLNGKYTNCRYVGNGRFSNVYICVADGNKFAVKMFKRGSSNHRYFYNEHRISKILNDVKTDPYNGRRFISIGVESFCHTEFINNEAFLHPCIVYPPLGDNILQLIRLLDGGFEIAYAKHVMTQLFSGLEFLHNSGIIHTDIKPENILLDRKASDINVVEDLNIKIIDLGSAKIKAKKSGSGCGTVEFCAPEVLLGLDYDESIDIWSAGCFAYEILTGDALFSSEIDGESEDEDENEEKGGGEEGSRDDESEGENLADDSEDSGSDDDAHGGGSGGDSSGETWAKEHRMLVEMRNLLGDIPSEISKRNSVFFNSNGKLKGSPKLKKVNLTEFLNKHYTFKPQQSAFIADYVLSMLKYKPNERPTVLKMLETTKKIKV